MSLVISSSLSLSKIRPFCTVHHGENEDRDILRERMTRDEYQTVSMEEGNEDLCLTQGLLSKDNQDNALQNISSSHLEKHIPFNNGASFSQTFLNLINVVSGVGVLSMPYAVAQGGWLSLVIFLLVGLLCYYTGILIQRCMRAHPSIHSYPDIGRYAFGPTGQNIIAAFMYIELYLVAISFLILEGDNLDKLFPGSKVEFYSVTLEGKKLFILLAAFIILPTTWLRDLAVLAYVSAIGLVASVVLTGSLVWACIADAGIQQTKGDMLNLQGLPTALGLYFVCFTGHAVFPTIYSSMRNKNQFSKVLFISTILCTLNYGLTAVLGYLIYGNEVQSQVTLNLPSDKIYTKIAIYTTLINPLAKYALLIAPITSAIEERISVIVKSSTSLVIRTLILLSTVVLASSIPFFGYLMSFIGSFLSVMATVLFPCVCYLKIYGSFRAVSAELVAILFILIIGVLVAVMGTYTSLQQIIGSL
ncbi:Transmembrane amino acid transporter family protein [Rhynchospora pubera]|uniref:Transmembrane amino acid transporter family protein n=1 Tax=Rhynchospora pubera TaxID=906938 RepID=A0AAV8G247_9POAL|nr:Transmembrane amino acid transporter family protein [Rhynchospora pubera]